MLTVNHQVLDGSTYVASTNILPPALDEKTVALIKEKGQQLADAAGRMGARGFIGFDTILTLDGQPVFTECNYRGTGSTNPEITAQKATNFTYRHGDLGWAFIPFIPFHQNSPNIAAVLSTLRESGVLYEGYRSNPTDLDVPQAILLYGILPGGDLGNYCLSFFWEQRAENSQKIFDKINEVLKSLGTNKRIPYPF